MTDADHIKTYIIEQLYGLESTEKIEVYNNLIEFVSGEIEHERAMEEFQEEEAYA